MNKFISIFFLFFFLNVNLFAISNLNDSSYINTKNITYNSNENKIELGKNSLINIDDINILTDKGIIDYNNEKIEIFGTFYFYQDYNILKGIDLVGNTELTKFNVKDVSYIYNNDLKIDSKKVTREQNEVYFYNNFLTPCEIKGFFNCPTWSLKIPKTKYIISEDKFIHYDSFLQIADKKVFYLPYLSHFGSKAPRQKGFLTPKFEFNLKGDTHLSTPYYFPLNKSSDITITPKFTLKSNSIISKKYEHEIQIDKMLSGGDFNLEIFNQIKEDNNYLYTNVRAKTKYTLNKNNKLSFNGIITNSKSNTRSINEDSIPFEEIFLKVDTYNFLKKNDVLTSQISTVESFDNSNTSQIPLSQSINYSNYNNNNKFSLNNIIDVDITFRNESSLNKPSNIQSLNLQNKYLKYFRYNNLLFNNKLIFNNNLNNYFFQHDQNLNYTSFKSSSILTSEGSVKINNFINNRLKVVFHKSLFKENKIINENSNSITFNYNNLFSDSRLFGNNLDDNSNRIIYGIEGKLINKKNYKFILKIGQSYDQSTDNNYLKKINQNFKFSDYAVSLLSTMNNYDLELNNRIDYKTFTKKELNYTISLKKPLDISFTYNETNKNAFENLSSDSKSLNIGLNKKINKNVSFKFLTDQDLKNNYSPYSQKLSLNIMDDCSELIIEYKKNSFNDNFNTVPEEIIGVSFYMDYLGFIGYEQTTDLFN